MEHDTFSKDWYSIFLDPIPEEHTRAEIAFIERHLPSREFPKLLDIACGPGRHDEILASKGYAVVGIDKNEPAVDQFFIISNMRERHLAGVSDPGLWEKNLAAGRHFLNSPGGKKWWEANKSVFVDELVREIENET